MPAVYLLDSGPLGLLAHNRLANRMAIESWRMNEVAAGATVYLSEVADYEVPTTLDPIGWLDSPRCGIIPITLRNRTMIELTEQQRHEIGDGGHPIKVIDPATNREFFLVRAEVFSTWKLAIDLDPREAYPAIDRAFAPGWDDAKMSDYDQYEQQER